MTEALVWQTVTKSSDPAYWVRGTELERAVVPNSLHRFVLCDMRTYDRDEGADREVFVRDAHTVSDADVRAGIRPKVVKRCLTVEEALDFCRKALDKER